MTTSVARDPFARGEYERTTYANTHKHLSCRWCGNTPMRLYSYEWESDDNTRYRIVHTSKLFCNIRCYHDYHG